MASPALPLPPQTHYINGLPHHSNTTTFFTHDPSTGAIIAQVHAATQSDINLAITTSQAAFQLWSKTSAIERSRILLRAVSLLRARNDEIAAFETLDTGKPLCETMSVDVASGADVLEYFAGVGMAAGTGKMIQLRESAWVYTRKEPLGVCVGIGAWNYPIQM